MATSHHGRFVWYDIASRNPANAIAFYTTVIGWGTQVWTESDNSYTMFTASDTPMGGVFPMREGMGGGPRWFPYIATNDMDRTLRRVGELGGQVQSEPQAAGDSGSWAMVQDPQGAEFCAWQYATRDAPPPAESVGNFSWHELTTTDHKAAFEFYTDLFGWEKTGEYDMGEDGVYQMFGLAGTGMAGMFGGMYNQAPDKPTAPSWLNYVRVGAVKQTWAQALASGAQELVAPMEVPGGSQIAVFLDPEGAALGIHEKQD
jgi:hypothetical protein